MARRTKLYQQPRSPLIQGQSQMERPFWQPWLVGMVGLAAWILLTVYLSTFTDSGGGSVWQHAAEAWTSDLPWMVLGGAVGSAVATLFSRAWGMRVPWLFAVLGAIGGAYVTSWLAWAIGALLS